MLLLVAWLIGASTLLGSRVPNPGWPVIQPLDTSVTFTDPGVGDSDTPFRTAIRDASGNVVYTLECHNGNYDDESLIDFSGDFQCGLFSHGADSAEETEFNLLATDTRSEESADWVNRGRMTAAQLRGTCAYYPEYGSVRHFALRGMLVTFHFTDVRWATTSATRACGAKGDAGVAPTCQRRSQEPAGEKLKEFRFRVTAVPDEHAQTSRATQVHSPRPPPTCEPID